MMLNPPPAEIESFLDEYAVFKPESNEIEIQAVELDFLTSKSPVMEALRLAKSLNCQVDNENLIMNIGF